MIGIAAAAMLRLLISPQAYARCSGGATLLGGEIPMKCWQVIFEIFKIERSSKRSFLGFNYGIFYHIFIDHRDSTSCT